MREQAEPRSYTASGDPTVEGPALAGGVLYGYDMNRGVGFGRTYLD